MLVLLIYPNLYPKIIKNPSSFGENHFIQFFCPKSL